MDEFRYQPLENVTEQIRLIQISHDDDQDSIHLLLSTWTLENAPPYVAISYTWGEACSTRQITVDEKRLYVRSNCWYALWQARHHPETQTYLWIDAICIDQSNLVEKSGQVGTMAAIFRQAETVVASVGAEGPDTHFLIAFMQSALQKPNGIPGLQPSLFSPGLYDSHLSTLDLSDVARLWTAFRDIASRPYWNRLWVVQELFVAQDILVLCGTTQVPAWLLEELRVQLSALLVSRRTDKLKGLRVRKLYRRMEDTIHNLPMQSILQYIPQALRFRLGRRQWFQWQSLEHVLLMFADQQCFDPRDRIYGLLSIVACPSDALQIVPDYTQSTVQVAVNVLALKESSESTTFPTEYARFLCRVLRVGMSTPEIALLARNRKRTYGVAEYCNDPKTLHLHPLKMNKPLPSSARPSIKEHRALLECCILRDVGSQRLGASLALCAQSDDENEFFTRYGPPPTSLTEPGPLNTDVDQAMKLLWTADSPCGLICDIARPGDMLLSLCSRGGDDDVGYVVLRRTRLLTGNTIWAMLGYALIGPEYRMCTRAPGRCGPPDRDGREDELREMADGCTIFFDCEDLLVLACLQEHIRAYVDPWSEEYTALLRTSVCRYRFSSFAVPGLCDDTESFRDQDRECE